VAGGAHGLHKNLLAKSLRFNISASLIQLMENPGDHLLQDLFFLFRYMEFDLAIVQNGNVIILHLL
jgi:hypothetical protein